MPYRPGASGTKQNAAPHGSRNTKHEACDESGRTQSWVTRFAAEACRMCLPGSRTGGPVALIRHDTTASGYLTTAHTGAVVRAGVKLRRLRGFVCRRRYIYTTDWMRGTATTPTPHRHNDHHHLPARRPARRLCAPERDAARDVRDRRRAPLGPVSLPHCTPLTEVA